MPAFAVQTVLNITKMEIKPDVGDNDEHRNQSWLNVVRQLYQLAWLSDRNELMIAWAKEQL